MSCLTGLQAYVSQRGRAALQGAAELEPCQQQQVRGKSCQGGDRDKNRKGAAFTTIVEFNISFEQEVVVVLLPVVEFSLVVQTCNIRS